MTKYEVNNLRNIAFVGHGDSGKTSLAESLLFKMGATSRLGEVEAGTSVCDAEPDEKERKNSIDCAIVYGNWQDNQINILDAPGYPDFIAEAISALAATDAAFLFINATAGIMINTRKMWDYLAKNSIPCAIVLTKLDLENVKLAELIPAIQETFGKECVPITLPDQTGPNLKEIISLLATAPDRIPENLRLQRDVLIERIVESDEKLLEKYLEGKELTQAELTSTLRTGFTHRKIYPILSSSVKKQLGIDQILNFIVEYSPSPTQVSPKKGRLADSAEVTQPVTLEAPFTGQVFKCVSDPYVGKISYLRIFSGELSPDSTIYNARTQRNEKIGKLFKPFGRDQRPITRSIAGDIISLTKVENVLVSDTLSAGDSKIQYPPVEFPQPMVALAVEPKSKGDEQRLSLSLAKMADSDPTFKVIRDRQTTELVISGLSNLHLDIVLGRLKRRYEVQVTTKQPKIPYKETITLKAEGHHKHKKQTGGRGQYGEVYLKLEPLERGKGFEFVNEIYGGAIPNQYVPAVEKGIKEVLEKGVIAGYPVVDLKVAVYDGSYHVVDSSEASFKIAASKAFKQGVLNAKPMLLEPIVNMEVTIPAKFMGDITGDLNTRRGRITGMESVGTLQTIKATVPLAEIASYSTELRSITGGEGHYAIEVSHYDIVPFKIQETIIARAKPTKEDEE